MLAKNRNIKVFLAIVYFVNNFIKIDIVEKSIYHCRKPSLSNIIETKHNNNISIRQISNQPRLVLASSINKQYAR